MTGLTPLLEIFPSVRFFLSCKGHQVKRSSGDLFCPRIIGN